MWREKRRSRYDQKNDKRSVDKTSSYWACPFEITVTTGTDGEECTSLFRLDLDVARGTIGGVVIVVVSIVCLDTIGGVYRDLDSIVGVSK